LARGEFGQGSDIDLAVAGVPPEAFFRAGAEIERAASGFKVDLIPLESATPFFLAEARRDGVVLP
jgi:predicted nucleotidyltransferase